MVNNRAALQEADGRLGALSTMAKCEKP